MPKYRKLQKGKGRRERVYQYRRDTKGNVLHDQQGKPIVARVTWRGMGYASYSGRDVPTKWVTGDTRDEVDRRVREAEDQLRQQLAGLPESAYYDADAKKVIVPHEPIKYDDLKSFIEGENYTVSDALRDYLASDKCRARNTTRQDYESLVRTHITVRADVNWDQPFGCLKLAHLTYEDMYRLDKTLATDRTAECIKVEDGKTRIEQFRRQALSPKSFAELRNLLRVAVKHARANPELASALSSGYHPAEYQPFRAHRTRSLEDVPSVSDVNRLIEVAKELSKEDESYLAMLALIGLVHQTLRVGEAQGLKWSDYREVDDERRFYIRRQVVSLKGGEELTPDLKTDASADYICISEALFNLIKSTKGRSQWVVPSPDDDNRWMSRGAIDKRFKVLKERSGYRHTLYQLKHAMIARLLEAGLNADTIMHLTRHTTPKMINEVYGRVSKQFMARAIDSLGAFASARPITVS